MRWGRTKNGADDVLSIRNGKTDAIEEISERFCVERSSAYKKKDRALAHLALLLYGR